MATYPLSTNIEELSYAAEYDTVSSSLVSGAVLRVKRRDEPLYAFELKHNMLSAANLATLEAFFRQCSGGYVRFTLVDPVSRSWLQKNNAGALQGIYVATGDGVTMDFDLPWVGTESGVIVYSGTTAKTLTTHYTISNGTGSDGRDVLTCVAGGGGWTPAAGERIGVSFTGYRAWFVIFGDTFPWRRSGPTVDYGVVVRLREALS